MALQKLARAWEQGDRVTAQETLKNTPGLEDVMQAIQRVSVGKREATRTPAAAAVDALATEIRESDPALLANLTAAWEQYRTFDSGGRKGDIKFLESTIKAKVQGVARVTPSHDFGMAIVVVGTSKGEQLYGLPLYDEYRSVMDYFDIPAGSNSFTASTLEEPCVLNQDGRVVKKGRMR